MCLPLLWYLQTQETGIMKRILQVTFFLTIPAVMFTYSRASAITLAVVLMALIMKHRFAVPLFLMAVITVMLASPLIPRRWFNRQQSTLTYEEDGSAMSRIENWKFCWLVAVNNPLVGVGFEFQRRPVFEKYAPQFLQKFGRAFNTHNIYLAILASHGFPSLAIFLGMIGFSVMSCRRIKHAVRGRPDLKWLDAYSDIVQVSVLAFLLNGTFVNMEYFDMPYHLVAVTASMKVVCRRLLAEETVEEPRTAELIPAAAV
jgi:putative inorganic carbon (hco3(-)) transporter